MVEVSHLSREPSDHVPLLISFSSRLDNKPRPFRFLNVWTSHGGLMEVVRTAWQWEVTGSPFLVVWRKLRAVVKALRIWNKETFGNVFDRVTKAEEAVAVADDRL